MLHIDRRFLDCMYSALASSCNRKTRQATDSVDQQNFCSNLNRVSRTGLLIIVLVCTIIPVSAQTNESWSELDEQATGLFNDGNYQESLNVFLKAVDAAKKEFGVKHDNYAGSLKSVGILYYYVGHGGESEAYLKEALAAYERHTGKFTSEYEDTLVALSYLYQAMGDEDKLLSVLTEQLVVSLEVNGKEDEKHFALQKQLAGFYMNRHEFSSAERILLDGLSVAKSNDEKSYGDFNALLFQLYAEQNLPEKAEPFFQTAKLIRNKIQQEFWKTIDFQSMTYSYEIDDQDARLAYWEEQATALKASEPASVNYARTLINLATLYQTQEDLKKAEPLLMEAKGIIETGGSVVDMGTISGSLGYFYDEMGNQTLSGQYYLEGLAYTRRAGREDINYGTACHNLSMNRWKHGDLRACELYEKTALLIYAGIDAGYTYYASASTGLAQVYEKRGDYAKAEAYQMEAVRIMEMAFGDSHYSYAGIAIGLARIYEKQKRIAEAEALFIKCMNIMLSVFGKDHVQYGGYCHELGQFYVRQQQYNKGVPLLREATTIKLNRVQSNFGHLSESEKKDLYRYGKYYIDNYAYCLMKAYVDDKRHGEALYDLMMSTKGLIFQSTTKARARIMASGDQLLIQSFRDWTMRRDYLAKIYAMSLEQRKNSGIDVHALEAEINASEKRLMQRASELSIAGFEEKGAVNWKQLKSKLKPGEAALEIVRTVDPVNPENVMYGAVIVKGGEAGQPELVVLPSGFDLETRDMRFYSNAIQSRIQDTSSYRKYWKPIADKLHGVKKVYVSPAGAYHQLSLPTLMNRTTGKYLAEEIDITIVGNTSDLLLNARKRGETSATYLIGYPDYEGDANGKSVPKNDHQRSLEITSTTQRYFNRETGSVTPLPGTLKEVETIQALLKKRNRQVSILTGDVASEDQLKKISNPSVLHIATHGFFLPNQQVTEAESLAGKKAQDPLLRSGLLLADCEQSLRGLTVDESEEDGILTAYEAMNLFLDKTELVILSACETGVGEIDSGEGVYGLQRAFQQAGSRYVLVSLWKVDDEATGLLMTKFYEAHLDDADYAAAFRQARAAVKAKYPEPYYWGAFVLIGL